MFNYERMAELLREKGLNQRDIAHAVGVSDQMISYIMRGLKEPSIMVLGRIAKALEVSVAELIVEK